MKRYQLGSDGRALIEHPNEQVIKQQVQTWQRLARCYSGSWSEARYREQEWHLLDALQRNGLQPRGAPIYARYNSPFSRPMLRRNEILVPLAESPDS
jgi:hypothetical protein